MDRPDTHDPAHHLSTPWLRWLQANSPMRALDAVVIGSGYGGAVAALRLAQKGWRVTVLERGSEYRPGEFPNDLAVLPKHVRAPSPDGRAVAGRATGLFEWRAGPGALALVANGVGGGSLINAGVLFDPDPDVFAQEPWPAVIRHDRDAPARGLARYLAKARDKLQGHRFADSQGELPFAKSAALHRLAQAIDDGAQAHPVEATIDPAHCTRCGDCASGCNVPGAKLTLRDTYLAEAVHRHGVRVLSRATVYTLQALTPNAGPAHDPAARWRLRVLPTERVHAHLSWHDCAREEGWNVDAALVVVAAGAFGSTELLQRSRDQAGAALWLSSALGSRFSANGDSLTFSTNENTPVNAVGVGANAWQTPAPAAGARLDHGVGPCISSVIDLRHEAGGQAPRALEDRLIIEEGAVPGAIGRLWAEGLATLYMLGQLDHWRFQPPRGALWQGDRIVDQPDPLSVGDHLAADARTAAQSLPRRTQVLLTMGHDGSKGRIVWVSGRDAAVPYWEDPQDLRTYQRQADVLQAVCNNGATLLHAPNWQLLPPSANTTMSGPKPEPALTTVHPLGGCAMGDDPATSVVDHLGRVWANDDGDLHAGLYVLDGAILPTALGVNPLLTITALAERAMDHLPAKALVDSSSHRSQAPGLPDPDPLYTPYQRPGRPRFEATMHERLVCARLEMRDTARNRGDHAVFSGDLQLTFEHADWLAMWDEPLHAPRLRLGAASILRLNRQATDASGATTNELIRFELLESVTRLIAARDTPPLPRWALRLPGPLGAGVRHALSRLIVAGRDFGRHPRALVTWLALRGGGTSSGTSTLAWLGDLWRREGLSGVLRALASLLKQLHHASERRAMLYDIRFRFAPDAATPTAAARDPWPAELRLIGQKQVSYAATWAELGRWFGRKLVRAVQPADKREPPPQLRASYLEQAGNLHVSVRDAARGTLLAHGRFDLDPHYYFTQLPLELGPRGDLTSGALALGAYFGLFSRFAIKTRLFDFRLPNYSGRALLDNAPPWQTHLRLPDRSLLPEAIDFSVPHGRSSSDLPGEHHDPLRLRLWRYARTDADGAPALPETQPGHWHGQPVTRVKSVLLVHAFSQSGYTYTLKSLPTNLAEAYYAAGYEVWILEHRLSTRLTHHREPCTIDQIGMYDWPGAVNTILRRLRHDFFVAGRPLVRPQIFAFAQCIGAASMSMALLSGRLAYRHGRQARHKVDPLAPVCPKLAGAVISQTHPFCIGTPLLQAKTWVPGFLRDTGGRDYIPFAVRGPVDCLPEAWTDRLFNALPLPEEEQCPQVHDDDHAHLHIQGSEDHAATCRRIRFIEAPLFKHRNLSEATHAELPLLFGDANVRLFAHAAKCVQAERLVNEDGFYTYVHDVNLRRYFALPLVFMHGKENELFHLESAQRSARQYQRLQPEWAALAGQALHGATPPSDAPHALFTVPGHGHIDVLIGQQAPQLVYPRLVQAFDHLFEQDSQGPTSAPHGPTHTRATARIPRSGPFIGRLRAYGHEALSVRLSFQIDDRFSDGKRSSRSPMGTRTWAIAQVRQDGRLLLTQALRLRRVHVPAGGITLAEADSAPTFDGQTRFGEGELRLPRAALRPDAGIEIEAFSVHETLVCGGPTDPAEPLDDVLPLHAALAALIDPTREPSAWPGGQAPAGLEAWLADLLARREARLLDFHPFDRPVRDSVSIFKLFPESPRWREAQVGAAALRAVWADAEEPRAVRFVAASCRYPGASFDDTRVNESIRAACPQAGATPEPHPHAPAFGLLVGDQIYADATGGMADPHSPTERFIERHRLAFRRARLEAGEAPRLGDMLARLPVYMTPDDHEYIDNFPNAAPIVKTRLPQVPPEQLVSTAVAKQAQESFQQLHSRRLSHTYQERQADELRQARRPRPDWRPLPAPSPVYGFQAGPVRALVIDTRSERACRPYPGPPDGIFSARTKRVVERWLARPAAGRHLNLIVTGSVAVPAQRLDADPANPGDPDDLSWSPADRQWLLDALAQARHRQPALRFMLLSGDYHVSTLLRLDVAGLPVGAAVVTPPLYSPMPYMDAWPEALWFDEPLSVRTPAGTQPLTLHSQLPDGAPAWRGSGLARLHVERLGTGYRIEMTATLRNWVDHADPCEVRASVDLP